MNELYSHGHLIFFQEFKSALYGRLCPVWEYSNCAILPALYLLLLWRSVFNGMERDQVIDPWCHSGECICLSKSKIRTWKASNAHQLKNVWRLPKGLLPPVWIEGFTRNGNIYHTSFWKSRSNQLEKKQDEGEKETWWWVWQLGILSKKNLATCYSGKKLY